MEMVERLKNKRPDALTSDRLRGTPTHNGAVVGARQNPNDTRVTLLGFAIEFKTAPQKIFGSVY